MVFITKLICSFKCVEFVLSFFWVIKWRMKNIWNFWLCPIIYPSKPISRPFIRHPSSTHLASIIYSSSVHLTSIHLASIIHPSCIHHPFIMHPSGHLFFYLLVNSSIHHQFIWLLATPLIHLAFARPSIHSFDSALHKLLCFFLGAGRDSGDTAGLQHGQLPGL